MNLVGIGADGQPCTPVYTYANSNRNSSIDSVARGSFFPPLADETVAKRLKDAIDRYVRCALGSNGVITNSWVELGAHNSRSRVCRVIRMCVGDARVRHR